MSRMVKCLVCEKEISEKSFWCIHCGEPRLREPHGFDKFLYYSSIPIMVFGTLFVFNGSSIMFLLGATLILIGMVSRLIGKLSVFKK